MPSSVEFCRRLSYEISYHFYRNSLQERRRRTARSRRQLALLHKQQVCSLVPKLGIELFLNQVQADGILHPFLRVWADHPLLRYETPTSQEIDSWFASRRSMLVLMW